MIHRWVVDVINVKVRSLGDPRGIVDVLNVKVMSLGDPLRGSGCA